jgi:hypothetical protein
MGVFTCIMKTRMKLITFCAIIGVIGLALSLAGQSSTSLTAACQIAGNPAYPDCVDGEVTFTGTGFTGGANGIDVRITNSSGKVLDAGQYQVNNGVLSFTENMSIGDTYSVYVAGTLMLTVATGRN